MEVWAGDYVQDLAEIMENSSRSTLFNYVGYRLMVHLSPLLPDEAAFLVPLSHEHAGTATHRFQVPARMPSASGELFALFRIGGNPHFWLRNFTQLSVASRG